ncbi:MAG: hypothetical protein V4819_10410 [Verrucomicrobiota bacterium]
MTATPLQEIRRQLREKFPAAHGFAPVREAADDVSKTLFETATFPAGAISEIIPDGESGGLSLWIAGLLAEPEEAAAYPKFVLVDGGDAFDPASHTAAACSQLLWVRCAKVQEALKAADLLVRDANVPFVMLDLCGLPPAVLRSIPASAWWRLKQLCETNACRLVVLAPAPLVPCTSLRLALSTRLTLEDFNLPRNEILQRVVARPNRLRHAT